MKIKPLYIILLITAGVSIIVLETIVFFSKPRVRLPQDALLQTDKLFDTADTRKDSLPAKKTGIVQLGENEPSKDEEKPPLPNIAGLELLGTALGNAKDPIAFIKDTTFNTQGIYRIGGMIREAKVVQINLGEIILDIKGERIRLAQSARFISQGKTGAEEAAIVSVSGSQIVINKSLLLNQPDTVINAVQEVKIRPYYKAKQCEGLMIEGISDTNLISRAGLRNKDVITAVNNQKIDSYQKALQIFSKVKNTSEINVRVLRNGEHKNLSYNIHN